MSKIYSKNGVSFQYSSDWNLIDEEWNADISALTLEDANEGIYMIDIYHSSRDRTLNDYLDIHFENFLAELPFGYKLIDGPTSSDIFNNEMLGIELEFTIRTLLISKHNYINSGFRIESANGASFLSSHYSKDNEVDSKKTFYELVSSYRLL